MSSTGTISLLTRGTQGPEVCELIEGLLPRETHFPEVCELIEGWNLGLSPSFPFGLVTDELGARSVLGRSHQATQLADASFHVVLCIRGVSRHLWLFVVSWIGFLERTNVYWLGF